MDLKILILVVAFFVCCSGVPMVKNEDRQYLTSVLEQVPESERKQFVAHQLYKGYILNHPDDVAIAVPEETTQKFYQLFLQDSVINPVDEEAYSRLCFPNGECVDIDDPGPMFGAVADYGIVSGIVFLTYFLHTLTKDNKSDMFLRKIKLV